MGETSPAVFCFLMGGAMGGLFCIPVATTTCEDCTAIMVVGAGCVGGGAMATAVFFMVFLGDSEEMGTLLSSYSFRFTVLFIWALEGGVGGAHTWRFDYTTPRSHTCTTHTAYPPTIQSAQRRLNWPCVCVCVTRRSCSKDIRSVL